CSPLAVAIATSLSFHVRGAGHSRRERPANQIQAIYRAKCDGKYNARPCDGGRKAAGAGTGASNGKNRAQNNGNRRRSGRALTHSQVISTPHTKNRPPPRGAGRTRPRLGFQP